MFIQTEQTPNPNSLKFITDEISLTKSKVIEIKRSDAGLVASMKFCKELFDIAEVESVYLTPSFVTVTKSEGGEWDTLKPQVLAILMDAGVSGEGIKEDAEEIKTEENREYTPIEKEIVELIEERVRPAVAMDGGDIVFEYFDEPNGIVYVKMKGSCSGCPSSGATLKDGIKNMLTYYIPEVKDVCAV